MQVHRKLTVAAVTMSMGLVPAAALAHGSGSASSNAKKYGKYCLSQNESKQHVAGQPGSPFSGCVKALAKLANGSSTNPKSACAATETKKHVAGQKGTPYSDCVAAAAKLHKAEHQSSSGSNSSSSSTSS
jgi:hypothetical protein